VSWDVVLAAVGVVALGVLNAFVLHYFARKSRRKQPPSGARQPATKTVVVVVGSVALLAWSLVEILDGGPRGWVTAAFACGCIVAVLLRRRRTN
jgi:hypothetical protein